MGIQNFEDSRIWQAAIKLAADVYRLAKMLPENEKFAMSSQIRRAVVSVSTNIAEGFGRTGKKEKIQFYNIAYGSLLETKSLLLLGVELGFFSSQDTTLMMEQIVSLQKQINATMTAVKKRTL
jgi:four helix bundle protein